jgi:hypothetical protein
MLVSHSTNIEATERYLVTQYNEYCCTFCELWLILVFEGMNDLTVFTLNRNSLKQVYPLTGQSYQLLLKNNLGRSRFANSS